MHKVRTVRVVYPYDLRNSIVEKQFDGRGEWTAYVNNAGQVIHLVHPSEDFYVRFRLPHSTKGWSVAYRSNYIRRYILKRMTL